MRLWTTRPLVSAALPSPRPMSEDHVSKQRGAARSAITTAGPAKNLVRPRPTSPLRLGDSPDDGRPTKRTRKAINCEPCRSSKLKCDRFVRIERSGCVLMFSAEIGHVLHVYFAVSHCCALRDLRPGLDESPKIFRNGLVMLSRLRWSTSPSG